MECWWLVSRPSRTLGRLCPGCAGKRVTPESGNSKGDSGEQRKWGNGLVSFSLGLLVSLSVRTLGRLSGRLDACNTEKPLQTLPPDACALIRFRQGCREGNIPSPFVPFGELLSRTACAV